MSPELQKNNQIYTLDLAALVGGLEVPRRDFAQVALTGLHRRLTARRAAEFRLAVGSVRRVQISVIARSQNGTGYVPWKGKP